MERYSKKYPSKWQNQYSDEFKHHVCNDFITGSLTRRQVEKKYNIGNSRLTYWLKDLGCDYTQARLVPLGGMPNQPKSTKNDSASNKKLRKELEDAKLLAEAYKRIIEKAEQELKIDIRKKSNTK